MSDDVLEYLIGVGAIVVMIVFTLIVRRAEATIRKPLPALDRTARTATVVGTQPDRGIMLVEVEYTDGDGMVRRECLADVICGPELDRFAIGTTWQVYGFRKPRGRCLLTETHDDLPRNGYHLDSLRIKHERIVFEARDGSSVLGVLPFRGDGTVGGSPVVAGRRTSWPGHPASAWQWAESSPAPLHRRRPTPRTVPIDGVLCDVFSSPLTMSAGDSDSETRILVDVHVPDEKAARIVAAFTSWASDPAARDAWGPVPLALFYVVITAEELFGPDAAGGYIARDCSIEPGRRALITTGPDREYPDAPLRRAHVREASR
ncbi:hypothetical protein RB608_24380 [Nocardioides sp. LHD-245]|uniref:hypothetical protein n=1 Tax=Nocardioides sp. LHD-245 TaxID=3051387 RepID=UPI0027DEE31A|nr:hypothetical protein [Nocardioides sp. LHD-245]